MKEAAAIAFVETVARLVAPGDPDEAMQDRVRHARLSYRELADAEAETDDEAILTGSEDSGFVESEAEALWALIRQAREILRK